LGDGALGSALPMAKPLYVDTFEHFKNNHEDPLNAYVAFGLYIEAECRWASSQANWPDSKKYQTYFDCTIPFSSAIHHDNADKVLVEFANNIVQEKQAAFLQSALDAYKIEAAKSHKGFLRGVSEATVGALVWSVILIVTTIISHRLGVDIVEAYQKASGI
jgi:hypothetical protein